MDILTVVLLIIGAVIFILSFVIPANKEEASGATNQLAKKEIEDLVSQELEGIKDHVDDVVEETIGYAMEKTERSLERLSNEKIMAVNEYSDTVLNEIHRNHEEVMFLYDMLNDKHKNLKNTVTEVNKTVKEVEETKKEAEAVVSSFQKLAPEVIHVEEDEMVEEPPSMEVSDETIPEGNSNEAILELYRQGKSQVAIAQELGLGVGEVRLVIELYRKDTVAL